MSNKVKTWLQKNQVMDKDLIAWFPKYGVNDPENDLRNLKPKQWKELQAKFKKDRAKELKDSAAKARFNKKITKIDKLWKKERDKLPKKKAKNNKNDPKLIPLFPDDAKKDKKAKKDTKKDAKKDAKKDTKKDAKKDAKKDTKKKDTKKDAKKDVKKDDKKKKKDPKDAKKDAKKDDKKKDTKKDAKKDPKDAKAKAKAAAKDAKPKDDAKAAKAAKPAAAKDDKPAAKDDAKPKADDAKADDKKAAVADKPAAADADKPGDKAAADKPDADADKPDAPADKPADDTAADADKPDAAAADADADKKDDAADADTDKDADKDADAGNADKDDDMVTQTSDKAADADETDDYTVNSKENLMKLSRTLLIKRCTKERIPKGGDKSELVARLLAHYEKQAKEEELAKQTNSAFKYNVSLFNAVNINDEEDAKVDDLDKEFTALVANANNNRFSNSVLINNKSYRNDNGYIDYTNIIKPKSSSFKAELVTDNNEFDDKQWNLLILKAKSIESSKDFKDKYKATADAGDFVNIKKGDNIGIEHILTLLIYVNFPGFVDKYTKSLADDASTYYYFGRFLTDAVTYFGAPMASDLTVYHGIKRDDDLLFDFFNTSFLTVPFSASGTNDVFDKDSTVLSLKAQFVGDFNDTNVLDMSYFNKSEYLFLGQFSELSIVNITTPSDDAADAKDDKAASNDYTEWCKALNYWQKLSSGFADYNDQKYLIEATSDDIQSSLLKLLNNDASVPEYIAKLFKYYNDGKTGTTYHRMYTKLLDIDFSKICNNGKAINKEIQALLFNDDVSDVDPVKIQKIFTNGVKYVDTAEQPKDFPPKVDPPADDADKADDVDAAADPPADPPVDDKADADAAADDKAADDADQQAPDDDNADVKQDDKVDDPPKDDAVVQDAGASDQLMVSLNASSFKYNKTTNTYTISVKNCKLLDFSFNGKTLTFEVANSEVNKDKSSISDQEIDTVLDEIDKKEKKADGK